MAAKRFAALGTIAFMSLLVLTGCNGTSESSSFDPNADRPKGENGATGAYNYLALSYDERAEILGQLEKYAMTNFLTGISIYDDGGSVLYSSRLEFPTENYVTGYGWGLMREGNISEPSIVDDDTTISNVNWYYHALLSTSLSTLNYMDSTESTTRDLASYAITGWFGQKLATDTNGNYEEGYEWYGNLIKPSADGALATPINSAEYPILEATEEGYQDLAYTWRYYLRTGQTGFAYRTASTKSEISQFNNRPIQAKDFEWAMRMFLSGDVGFSYASSYTEDSPIVGAADYYQISRANGYDSQDADDAWEDVGFKVGSDDYGDYVDVTFTAPTNEFYAMYQMTSAPAPFPEEWWNIICQDTSGNVTNFGAFASRNSDRSYEVIDTTLSVGPYYLIQFNNQTIAFAKNDQWWEQEDEDSEKSVWNIQGFKYTVNTGLADNQSLYYSEFKDGKTDVASLTQTTYNQAISDNYGNNIRQTEGTSNFKMNVNALDQNTWNAWFGPTGSVAQNTTIYNVKPIMSNYDFLNGVYCATDRQTLAASEFRNPAFEFYADAYLIDPELGISYNDTTYHQENIADYYPETYGYNRSAAQTLFNRAIETLIADGSYKSGDDIVLTCWQQDEASTTGWGADWSRQVEDAFNSCTAAQNYNLTLTIEQEAVVNWSDVYYAHLLVGNFDFGFGSISGSAMDPLGFMYTLKSDNSSGFTLNWSVDTSWNDGSITYDVDESGEPLTWSFDALYDAADAGTIVSDGMVSAPVIYIDGSLLKSGTILELQFDVDTELCASAGIDPETDFFYFYLEATITDTDSTLTDTNNQAITTFTFYNYASWSYDPSTEILTLQINVAEAYNEAGDYFTEGADIQAYNAALVQAFTQSGNSINIAIEVSASMEINRIPTTGYFTLDQILVDLP